METETISLKDIEALRKSGAKIKGSPRSTMGPRPEPRQTASEPKQDIAPLIDSMRAETQRALQAMKQMSDESIANILRTITTTSEAQAQALERAISALHEPSRPIPKSFELIRDEQGRLLSVKPIYDNQ